ncbi:MAG TPA: NUDIX domain-containing protein [Candidatus Saccharimonadales bacterium]|nr:NUDIX domain-containing protein [Candidatus Saccharimonadales bacterium]
MDQTAPEFASVILTAPDGRYILQLRDDKPGIVDPGKLSLFASRLQDGETPNSAALRTLLEEASIGLSEDKLKFYARFEKNPARHHGAGASHVFVATIPVDPAQITVHQGQGYRLVTPNELQESQTASITYDILRQYLADNA